MGTRRRSPAKGTDVGGGGGPENPRGFSSRPAAVPVDVLQTLGMKDGREGVAVTAGICTRRPGTEDPDFAFRVDNRTQLSAPTRQLFPDSSFPEDFSILATVRARRGGQAFLLSVYDERGVQQLGVEVGRSPVFLYEDQDGHPAPERYPVFRKVNLADGRWHRVALAVEGTNVSLLVDCHLLATLPLERGPRPVVSTEGVTLFGARLLDEEVFEVRPPSPPPKKNPRAVVPAVTAAGCRKTGGTRELRSLLLGAARCPRSPPCIPACCKCQGRGGTRSCRSSTRPPSPLPWPTR
uniref:Thrombospondin-like N-terminal domain-containing protein n=1 Tax=Anser cygnoides TaxID=8845 RepID=A0A8B9DQ56_ANSCY